MMQQFLGIAVLLGIIPLAAGPTISRLWVERDMRKRVPAMLEMMRAENLQWRFGEEFASLVDKADMAMTQGKYRAALDLMEQADNIGQSRLRMMQRAKLI